MRVVLAASRYYFKSKDFIIPSPITSAILFNGLALIFAHPSGWNLAKMRSCLKRT